MKFSFLTQSFSKISKPQIIRTVRKNSLNQHQTNTIQITVQRQGCIISYRPCWKGYQIYWKGITRIAKVEKPQFRSFQAISHGLRRYLAVWWSHHPHYRIFALWSRWEITCFRFICIAENIKYKLPQPNKNKIKHHILANRRVITYHLIST